MEPEFVKDGLQFSHFGGITKLLECVMVYHNYKQFPSVGMRALIAVLYSHTTIIHTVQPIVTVHDESCG